MDPRREIQFVRASPREIARIMSPVGLARTGGSADAGRKGNAGRSPGLSSYEWGNPLVIVSGSHQASLRVALPARRA